MHIHLKVWRQKNANTKGNFVSYHLDNVSPDMSFLEMLDTLNEELLQKNEEPISFDHDCREGICGSCSLVVNGDPHGKEKGTTVCQLHMRSFQNGETIVVEPFRARAFPVVKDLIVDRSSMDRLMQSGGYISVRTGSAPEANAIPVNKKAAEDAFDAATCIGCGACVAVCKNASAMLFVGAKASHLSLLPQGKVEEKRRVLAMVDAMNKEGFGNCTNTGACSSTCPKEISLDVISNLNSLFLRASLHSVE